MATGSSLGTAPSRELERPYRSPRAILTTICCVLGLGIATYLTLAHYTNVVSLTCPASGHVINCEKVTTSPESAVFGIPVALLGLLYFVAMTPLCLPLAWRSTNRYVAPLRLALAISGIGFVFYLLYSELFTIKAICLWCSAVHILTLVLFGAIVTGWDEATAPLSEED
jgi:uncharacterized membrane protein